MKSLPPDCKPYKRTPTFSEATIPAGLLRRHTTRAGTWGRIVVLDGHLRYRILEPDVEDVVLTPQLHGVVEPLVAHEVAPLGAVSFFVEFLRKEAP